MSPFIPVQLNPRGSYSWSGISVRLRSLVCALATIRHIHGRWSVVHALFSWICSLSNNWDVDNYNWLHPNSTYFYLVHLDLVFQIGFTSNLLSATVVSFTRPFFPWKSIIGSRNTITSKTSNCNHTIHHLLSYKIDPHKIDLFTYLIWRTEQLSNGIKWH